MMPSFSFHIDPSGFIVINAGICFVHVMTLHQSVTDSFHALQCIDGSAIRASQGVFAPLLFILGLPSGFPPILPFRLPVLVRRHP